MAKQKKNDELREFIELMITAQNTKPDPLFSAKSLNALLIAAIIGICAFVWTSVTSTPQTFSAIQQQNTEIRTMVGEMRTTLQTMAKTIETNQRDQAQTSARMAAVEQQVKSNGERLDKLERK